MKPSDWLLIFLALPAGDADAAQPSEPVRIMKGMFLFAQEAAPADEAYEFVPYNYGPCSFEIYSDLEEFIDTGLVITERPPNQTWIRYMPTVKGLEIARRMQRSAPGDLVEKLGELKTYITARPFMQLLREVYAKYPQYAVNSVVAH